MLAEVETWQQRPLESTYVAVAFDALRVKIRDEGVVQNKAVYLALGVQLDGTKEVLGFWIAQTEGAAFWHRVFRERQGRGVTDILIALIDGLTGLPDALQTVFPHTVIHQCIVHLVRQSLHYVSWTERKLVAAALRAIYQAPNEAAGRLALQRVAESPLGLRHAPIVAIWERPAPLGAPLGADRAGLGVPAGDSSRALHHECDRKPQHADPQSDQDPRPLPER